MNKMVFSNLAHRPLRTAISVVAISIEVTLILLVVGLLTGVLADTAERQRGVGADIMVQPPGSSFIAGVSGAPVSVKIADVLRRLPHITVVSPVVTQINTSGNVEVINGIELDPNSPNDFDRMGAPFKYIAGGEFQGPDDMIIDDIYATDKKVKVGDMQKLLNHDFRVSGIVLHGKGARKFLPMKTMQELLGSEGKATMFYVKVDDPANIEAVQNEIKSYPGLENYPVRSMQQYMSMMTGANLPGFKAAINVVIGVAVIIGFIVIFQSMYTAVMERTREIGILKSLGASKLYIINVILRETALLAVVGVIVGIALSFLSRWGIRTKFPLQTIMINGEWILRASIIAITGALLGALYPAMKAAQKDPIDALAYE